MVSEAALSSKPSRFKSKVGNQSLHDSFDDKLVLACPHN